MFYYDNAIKYLCILQGENKFSKGFKGGRDELYPDKGRIRPFPHLLSTLCFRQKRTTQGNRRASTYSHIDSQAPRALTAGLLILASLVLPIVYADDTEDPVGLCLAGNQKVCDKLDIMKLMAQLDQRAKQWNGDMKVCFDSPEMMNKFLEDNPGGNFNVTVPCPPMPKHIPEDESGK